MLGSLGELYSDFEKEDMSEMFRRAFLEKMALVESAKKLKWVQPVRKLLFLWLYNTTVCS